MPHVLITGTTTSGKTRLAKRMASEARAGGLGVIVLDPYASPGWDADAVLSDPDQFLKVFWESERCACFIDEAGDAVGKYDEIMARTATRGRHAGHRCYYIVQRPTLISRTVREQCVHLFAFASSPREGAFLAEEWAAPGLAGVSELPQGHYLYAARFGQDGRVGQVRRGVLSDQIIK